MYIFRDLCYTISGEHRIASVMQMFRLKKLLWVLPICALLAIPFYLLRDRPTADWYRFPEQTLVIDPGHGGEDGGAVAVSGNPESGINLEIAQKTDQLCGLYGVHVFMLRQEDISLADPEAKTLREKKRSDLKKRVEIVNQTPNGVLLSIHQNNYPSASSHGAQVFFHKDEQSRLWAEQMQELLRTRIEPENTRKAAQIPDSVYLMKNVTCCAVLVECGFLSNPEEDALLESPAYQTRLAAVLTASYLQFIPTEHQGEMSN